jgi:UDP-glucose 4-epimerase
MKIVITGGSGYIGTRLSLFLSKQGHEVITVCATKIPQKKGWTDIIHQFIVGDIRNIETINKISEVNADVIIHLVSLDHHDSEKAPNYVSEINVQSTWNLLETCTKNGLKKFIYFSTIHVYGKNQKGLIKENQHPTPFNTYGLTHYLSEEICNTYNRKTNTNCINLRLSNSYGEPVFKEAKCWDLVINNLCLSAKNQEKIILKGDGSPIRDFIHYESICDSVEQILQIEKNSNQNTFHISSGNSYSMLELAFKVQEIFNKRYGKLINVYINNVELVTNQKPPSPHIDKISNDKISSIIDFKEFLLEKGIDGIFNYLDSNKIL